MPVRRLTRGGTGEQCGDANLVTGATQNPTGTGAGQARQAPDGDVPMDEIIGAILGGMAEVGEIEPAPAKREAGGGSQGEAKPKQEAQPKAQEQEPPQMQAQSQKQDGGAKSKQKDDEEGAPAWLKARATTYSPSRLQLAAANVIAELHAAKQELAKELEANLKQLKSVLQETQKIAKDMEAVLKEAQAKPNQEELAKKADQPQAKGESWDPPTVKKSGKQQSDDQSQDDQESDKKPPAWSPPEDALQPQQQQH